MGRNSSNRKKIALQRKRLTKISQVRSVSINDLILKAQEKIDSFQYEEAQVLCQEILQRDADHIAALELSGNLCIEMKNLDGAKKCYGRAITLQPDEGYRKYLAMGQLLDGKESGQCYLKGIELMVSSLNRLLPYSKQDDKKESSVASNENVEPIVSENGVHDNKEKSGKDISENTATSINKPDVNSLDEKKASTNGSSETSSPLTSSLKREISSAYCSLSELYTTDLCDEDEAESNCKKYITLSIESDTTNPEAYQQMANFLLIKQDIEESKKYMKQSVDLWLPKHQSIVDGKAEGGSFDPIEVCPLSYDTRLSSARLLIELEQHDTATDVLDTLIEEDDQVVDTWYLLGLNNYLSGEESYDSARENFAKALQVNKTNPNNDESVLQHINELLEEIGEKSENMEDDNQENQDIDEDIEISSSDDEVDEMECS